MLASLLASYAGSGSLAVANVAQHSSGRSAFQSLPVRCMLACRPACVRWTRSALRGKVASRRDARRGPRPRQQASSSRSSSSSRAARPGQGEPSKMASTGDDAARKVNATEVAEPFRQETQRLVQAMPAEVKPLLVGFLASEDVASKRYAEWTGKSCRKDGIEFELRECKPLDLEAKVQEANEDPKVHGIMIYYPCFGAVPSFYGGRMDDHLRDLVAVEKDVEGLCYTYRHNLYHNVRQLPMISGEPSDKKCLLPCTPLALVKILEYLKVYDEALPLGDRMSGQTVTIINRSEIVGRPLGAMLANDGADVYSVDIDSIYLMRRAKMLPTEVTVEEACKMSRVIVTGVPSENYKLPSEWVQPGTVVLNVSHFKNVDEEALLQISGVRYVPLVGKVTVAMLERNLIRLINNFHLPDSNVKVVEAGGRVVNV